MHTDKRKEVEQRERFFKEDARKEGESAPPGLETFAPSYVDETGSTSLGVNEPTVPETENEAEQPDEPAISR